MSPADPPSTNAAGAGSAGTADPAFACARGSATTEAADRATTNASRAPATSTSDAATGTPEAETRSAVVPAARGAAPAATGSPPGWARGRRTGSAIRRAFGAVPVSGVASVRVLSGLIWLPVILLSTYVGQPPVAHPWSAAAAAVVGGIAWTVLSLRPTQPWRLNGLAIVVLAGAGVGFLVAAGGWAPPLGFCFYAVIAAGARMPATAAVATLVGTAVGVVVALRDEHPVSVLLTVLGLAGVLVLGMSRRESARRAEQREQALVAAARVQEERALAAALAERARIARDVHDVLAHSLSALSVQLQGARLMLLRDGAPPDTLAQVERAQRLAAEGLVEARRAVTALRTEPVDLADGLRALVADTPHATLEIDGEPPALDARAQETLLRTAQEALTNARRHATGASVTVRVRRLGDTVELEVRDRTGSPPPPRGAGYGLVGMAERAALTGADLDAGPTEDGWRVRLRLPPGAS